jgi:hypothetical protein
MFFGFFFAPPHVRFLHHFIGNKIFIFFPSIAWSPSNLIFLVPLIFFFSLLVPLPIYYISFIFMYFEKSNINVDSTRKINQWFWNVCINSWMRWKQIFEFLILLKRPWKWRNYIKNIFFWFFCILKIFRKIRDKKLGYDMKDKLKKHKKTI